MGLIIIELITMVLLIMVLLKIHPTPFFASLTPKFRQKKRQKCKKKSKNCKNVYAKKKSKLFISKKQTKKAEMQKKGWQKRQGV